MSYPDDAASADESVYSPATSDVDPHYERAQRLAAILESAVDGIVTINSAGIILDANPATERMFGYARDEIIGQNVSVFMPEPYASEHNAYIDRYLASRQPHIIGVGREVIARRKDGTLFPVHLAVSEVDHLRTFTGIVRDLSDVKAAQEKLIQSERLAAIGQMVAGLAHESRNALQRTRASLDMLELDLEDSPEELELIRRGQTALNELNRLYGEVQSYAAPLKLEVESRDLTCVWETAWIHLAEQHRKRNIAFFATTNDVDATIRMDSDRIRQVIRNLLENSISAVGEPGEIRIECAESNVHNQPAVRITITDNGPGFESEQLQRAFEPFFTTKTKGTGLGMAIAKRIVEAHGGTIDIDNAVRGGAEVIVTLPRDFREALAPHFDQS